MVGQVPATFGLLTNVQMLRLDCNKLVVVNPCLGFMHSLTRYRIGSMIGLANLLLNWCCVGRLWLSLNNLMMLPPELSYCTALTDLRLDTNPLKSPPRAVSPFVSPLHLLHTATPHWVVEFATVRPLMLDAQVQVGGCTPILSYLGKLMIGKLELEVDLSYFNLVTVPFEVTYLRFS